MASFRYRAVSSAGKTLRGALDADTEQQAVTLLYDKGLVPLHVERVTAAAGAVSHAGKVLSGQEGKSARGLPASWPELALCWRTLRERLHPVPQTAVAGMARQLATLLQAGLPLDEALGTISAHEDMARMQGIVAQLRERIVEGGDLADGLAAFPHVFSSTFVTMVRAGEASGTLELVIARFAEHIEQQVALVRKVQAALAYPLLMLVVGVGVVIFLLTFVIPKVTQIFADMDKALPMPTQILLAVSDGLREGWWLMAAAACMAVLALWRARKSARGRRLTHRALLRFPILQGIYRPLIVGHMTRTLGMLLKHGVPLVKALRIVQSVSDNTLLTDAVQRMIDGVQAGNDVSAYMTDPVVFPPLVRQMVAAGERSGQLSEMLLWVANDCEGRVGSRLHLATSLLEPIMILLLGGIMGFVVIAIMLPIFEMSSLMG